MNLNFEKNGGFITAVAVCELTKDVLMVAHMNKEAWKETLRTGYAVYFSRSRNCLWKKGEESGHVQQVRRILVDCDLDSVVLIVSQSGDACHVGFRTCFFRQLEANGDFKGVVYASLVAVRRITEDQRQKAFSEEIL